MARTLPLSQGRTPSLSITDGDDGRPLVHCHAGCEQSAVIEALRAKGLWNGYEGTSTMRAAFAEKLDSPAIILPIPDNAPFPPIEHPTLGLPVETWNISTPAVINHFRFGGSSPKERRRSARYLIGLTAGNGAPYPSRARSMASTGPRRIRVLLWSWSRARSQRTQRPGYSRIAFASPRPGARRRRQRPIGRHSPSVKSCSGPTPMRRGGLPTSRDDNPAGSRLRDIGRGV